MQGGAAGSRSRSARSDQPGSALGAGSDKSRRRWHFGRAILDEVTQELLVDGVEAEIERKALEVLVYLLEHAGEVCTKDELLLSVWPGRILSETVLTKQISRLRDVLHDDAQGIIKTAYGFGYRFIAPVRVELSEPQDRVHFDFHTGTRVPNRPHWILVERLGAGGHGEAWRVRHDKTGANRVFKFALEERALSALKREITLFRVIHDTLGDDASVAKLLDWNLEHAPYFIESEYFPAGTLADWATAQGGLGAIPIDVRIETAVQIARAVAAVHSVGVLHKDLKPSNILIDLRPDGTVGIALADFGSGGVLDISDLSRLGITHHGFTKALSALDTESSGTPMYLAPEIVAGQPFTVKSDLYAIGVILYQLVVGDFRKTLSPGWERAIDDPVLREDIALAAEGSVAERLGDAETLAKRLAQLDARRLTRAQEKAAREHAARMQHALERARAWRAGLALAMTGLAAGLAVSTLMYLNARHAQIRAERAVATTTAVSKFLTNDLFGSFDVAKHPVRDLNVKEVLDAGAAQIDSRFSDAPDVAADLHAAIGRSYAALELPSDVELERALALYDQRQGVGSAPALDVLTLMLSYWHAPTERRRLTERAESVLVEGTHRHGAAAPEVARLRMEIARSRFHFGEWARAAEEWTALAAELDRRFPGDIQFGGNLSRLIGTVMVHLGNFSASEPWLNRALDEIQRTPDHSGEAIAMVHMGLGMLYAETERFTAADAEFATALAQIKRWVADDSTETMQVRRNQANALLDAGHPRESIAILEDLLHMVATLPGHDDREETALMRYVLGLAYQAEGKYSDAVAMLRGALERNELTEGADYPTSVQMRIALADALRLEGQYDAADALVSYIEQHGVPGVPNDHPIIGEFRRVQGLLLVHQGFNERARTSLAQALAITRSHYGPTHWRTRRIEAESKL